MILIAELDKERCVIVWWIRNEQKPEIYQTLKISNYLHCEWKSRENRTGRRSQQSGIETFSVLVLECLRCVWCNDCNLYHIWSCHSVTQYFPSWICVCVCVREYSFFFFLNSFPLWIHIKYVNMWICVAVLVSMCLFFILIQSNNVKSSHCVEKSTERPKEVDTLPRHSTSIGTIWELMWICSERFAARLLYFVVTLLFYLLHSNLLFKSVAQTLRSLPFYKIYTIYMGDSHSKGIVDFSTEYVSDQITSHICIVTKATTTATVIVVSIAILFNWNLLILFFSFVRSLSLILLLFHSNAIIFLCIFLA